MFTLNVDGRTVEYSVLHAWDDGVAFVASQYEQTHDLAASDRVALAFNGGSGAWVTSSADPAGNFCDNRYAAYADMTATQACKLRANNIRRMVKAAILPHYNALYRLTYAVEIENTTDADSLIHLAEVMENYGYNSVSYQLRAIAQVAGL